jgi:hypothetical protein
MLGLIKADLASTGKPHLCNRTPSLFLNFRALNALFFEGTHLDLQIVTHEIEFVGTTLIGRVDCGFCRRQGENQPAMTCIHESETEDIAEEGAVGLGILTVDNYVSAKDHLLLPNLATAVTLSTDGFSTLPNNEKQNHQCRNWFCHLACQIAFDCRSRQGDE